MANCINENSKEYKELLEKSGLHPVVLKSRISLWQDANSVDNFPKLEDILYTKVIPLEINNNSNSLFINDVNTFTEEDAIFKNNNYNLFNSYDIPTEISAKEVLQNVLNNYNEKVSEKGKFFLE